jgi:hypothetical protein
MLRHMLAISAVFDVGKHAKLDELPLIFRVFDPETAPYLKNGASGFQAWVDLTSFLLKSNLCTLQDRDSRGWSCLHYFFRRAYGYLSGTVEDVVWKKVLVYALKAGASPYAADSKLQSVSDAAYVSRRSVSKMSRSQANFLGDLWDSVLAFCGYDISGFQDGFPGRNFGWTSYSRTVFESLWEDQQLLCPELYRQGKSINWDEVRGRRRSPPRRLSRKGPWREPDYRPPAEVASRRLSPSDTRPRQLTLPDFISSYGSIGSVYKLDEDGTT